MRTRARIATALLAAAATAGALAGCTATNHDAPNPPKDIQVTWWRVETPPSFTTLMFGCLGKDGLLMDQQDGNTAVTPNDPMCPAKGGVYHLVIRHGSQAPEVVSGPLTGPVPGTP
jgi:type IV secretory pathway protease TraF